MARILYVEDSAEWRELVKRSLPDHHVDTASSAAKAIELLISQAKYDVALVDYNLLDRHDRQGGEVLDMLLANYMTTRRIVITGEPPKGSLRRNLFDRYRLDELLIKGDVGVPDLRASIEAVLRLPRDTTDSESRESRSALRHRLGNWSREVREDLKTRAQRSGDYYFNVARMPGETAQRAEEKWVRDKDDLRRFDETVDRLRARLEGVTSPGDLHTARDELDALEAMYDRHLKDD